MKENMDAKKRIMGEHEFWLVGSLQLRRSSTGRLMEYTYIFEEHISTNLHSAGPFCYFSLPQAPQSEGVYAIHVGDKLKYIGECANLAGRFSSAGYGHISKRNCHHDGQSTNCKINRRILAAAKIGEVAEVWFHHTSERKRVESQLIAQLSPPWNGRESGVVKNFTTSSCNTRIREPSNSGKRHAGSAEDFRRALQELLGAAERKGAETVTVRAGDLHRIVGGYPGPNHRMPVCCSVMRSLMLESDRLVHKPPKGNGANLIIEYLIPRL